MKKEKVIYGLINDLLRYLLKYVSVKNFTEKDVERALEDSDAIIQKYQSAPAGIGYLAWKLFVAANSYFQELDRRKRKP